MKKHFFLFFITFAICGSISAQKVNYNKYSFKLSVSNYNGYLFDIPPITFGNEFNIIPNKHFNANLHFTYKLTEVSELGINVGLVKYYFIKLYESSYFDHVESTAPIIGVNYNFHILPLFFKQIKNINLYFCMKYELTYLPKIGEDYAWVVLLFNDPLKNKFRQMYGIGIGGSVLFYNHFGFFLESYLGDFSLYPDLVSSFSNTKIGIQISW